MAVTIKETTEEMAMLLLEMIKETSQYMSMLVLTDHFDPLKQLGKGSYGKVLLAKHRTSGQMVALKMMSKEKTVADYFLLEYSISRYLSSHPHIITTYGTAFSTDKDFVFVQEVAPVGSLLSLVTPKVGLQEEIVKRCALQLVSALKFMHSKGLVHRDIKLDNILLMDRECHCIKLADFGLTRIQGTCVPAMSWTIPYMAPELCILGDSEQLLLHPSLDVWAFGVLVYIMLTGNFPWNETLSRDHRYREFLCWREGKDITHAPSEWKKFTYAAASLFFQLLAHDAAERCCVMDISSYINLPWKAEVLPEDACGRQGVEQTEEDQKGQTDHVSTPSIHHLYKQNSAPPSARCSNWWDSAVIPPVHRVVLLCLLMLNLTILIISRPTRYIGLSTPLTDFCTVGIMPANVSDMELIMEGLISLYSQDLNDLDLQKYFKVIRNLGSGSFGSVLLVQRRKTDQKMALKLIKRTKTSQRSFLMEFSASFFLSSHPNIIGNYGFVLQTSDHFAFAQELSPLGDLHSMIPVYIGLPEDTVKRCAAQISYALDFMENKGFVHLDIKPENILVFDPKCRSIKITDFGLTRLSGQSILSRTGSSFYMSPEVCGVTPTNHIVADPRMDVWSFGVILFLLTTGDFPWEIATARDTHYARFAYWQSHFPALEVPSPWNRLNSNVRTMFKDILAVDIKERKKATEVLFYMDETWKIDFPQPRRRKVGVIMMVPSKSSMTPPSAQCSNIVLCIYSSCALGGALALELLMLAVTLWLKMIMQELENSSKEIKTSINAISDRITKVEVNLVNADKQYEALKQENKTISQKLDKLKTKLQDLEDISCRTNEEQMVEPEVTGSYGAVTANMEFADTGKRA
ncbi:ribosomal protein S6 kinase alpha-5-like [Pelodytes ibericus]